MKWLLIVLALGMNIHLLPQSEYVWYVPPQTPHHPISCTPLELCQLEYPYQMQPLEFKPESWVQIPLLPLPTKSADAYARSIHDAMVEDLVEGASIKIAHNGDLRSSQDDVRGKCVVLLFAYKTEGTRSEQQSQQSEYLGKTNLGGSC